MEIKKDWLILLASTIVGLVIGIILFGHATFASAATYPFTLTEAGLLTFTLDGGLDVEQFVRSGARYDLYNPAFPLTTNNVASVQCGGACNTTSVEDFLAISMTQLSSHTFEWDLETVVSATDGIYWLNITFPNLDSGAELFQMYDFERSGGTWIPTDISTSTHITTLNSPNDGETTGSTTVNFSVSYISNIPIADEICIAISGTFQTLNALCSPVTQSGNLNFSTSTTLTLGQAYTWYAFIRGVENEIIDQSSIQWFSVVTPQQTLLPSATTSTSTLDSLNLDCTASNFVANSFCNLAVQLLIPSDSSVASLNNALNSLMLKQPFSAFKEFRDGWNEAVRNPTVANGGYTMTFQGESIPILSSSTVYGAIGETTTNNLRAYMSIALWIFFGVGMYLAVTRLF